MKKNLFICAFIGLAVARFEGFGQFRLSVNPTVNIPLKEFEQVVREACPALSFTVYRYTRQLPISIGVSLGFQFFPSQPERIGKSSTYDLFTIPLLLGFRYDLLPESVIRPYYGAEVGALFYRYRIMSAQGSNTLPTGVAAVFAPNGGFRFETFEDLILDLHIRYQFAFHDSLLWNAEENIATQGFRALGISLGFSYPVGGNYRY